MKKILAVLMFVAGASFAQDKEPDVKPVKFDAYCMSSKMFGVIAAKYEEQPMMVMISGRTVGEKDMEFTTVMFANPKTGSWSLVERIGEDVFCVVATGSKLAPYLGDRPPNSPNGNVPKKYEQSDKGELWVNRELMQR